MITKMYQFKVGLRKKITAVIVVLIIAIMGPLTVINITQNKNQRLKEMKDRAIAIAKSIGISLYEPLLKEEPLGTKYYVLAETICQEEEDIVSVVIKDYDDNIIGQYPGEQRAIIRQTYNIRVPIEYSNIDLGEIEMVFSLKKVNSEIIKFRNKNIRLTLILMIIGIIIAHLLSTTIIRPIEKLVKVTKVIGEGDLGQRVDIRTHDEIEELGLMFNKMTANLAEYQRKLRQHIEDLKHLGKLTLDISTQIYQENLLDIVVKNFVDLAKVNKCSLMLLNESTNELVMRYGIGVDELVKHGATLKLGEGIAGKAAASGNYILIDDILKSEDYIIFSGQKPPQKSEALLSIPLLIEKKVIGVITVNDKRWGGTFSEAEVDILLMFANHIAAVIHNARLYELAVTDGLTLLYVHRYFQLRITEEIDRAKRYGRPLSLLMLDIDNFKLFNDTYGHQEGDRLLINVSRIMKSCVRVNDIVCRYGGEEFAIILVETEKEGAKIVAERIRKEIEEFKFTIGSERRGSTISIGIGTWETGWTKEMLINKADKALYKAKSLGKNRVEMI
ncbi:MAG: diguanylate cyclase [Candidatus Hydrogenedentota bacterium]